MRDYRGKRVDNGEWVYGSYVELNYHNSSDYVEAHQIVLQNGHAFEVIPESVGQYTGLKDVGLYLEGKFDKQGETLDCKKMYELDILEVVANNVFADGYQSYGGGQRPIGEKFVIVLMGSGFTLVPIKKYSSMQNGVNAYGYVNNYNFWNAHSSSLKVIGNTTDNKKLLEGQK